MCKLYDSNFIMWSILPKFPKIAFSDFGGPSSCTCNFQVTRSKFTRKRKGRDAVLVTQTVRLSESRKKVVGRGKDSPLPYIPSYPVIYHDDTYNARFLPAASVLGNSM